jgi:hypothetical protein
MRACVQLGHVGSTKWGPGAPYEEDHIKLVAPYVVKRLQNSGCAVDVYGGDMPFGMTHDVFVSIHCDSWSTASLGWSLGFRDDTHPGSSTYAHKIKESYLTIPPLGSYQENHTIGLHHYNGFSHFGVSTKVCLVEMQFVSNPVGRAWIEARPEKIGVAIANGMLNYLGKPVKEEDEMSVSSTREVFGRTKLAEGHAHIGANGSVTEDAWIMVTALEPDTIVYAQVWNNDVIKATKDGTKNPPYKLNQWKQQVIGLSGFGISGTISWRIWSEKQILISADYRVTTC